MCILLSHVRSMYCFMRKKNNLINSGVVKWKKQVILFVNWYGGSHTDMALSFFNIFLCLNSSNLCHFYFIFNSGIFPKAPKTKNCI